MSGAGNNDHVRLALPAEARFIATVQRRIWAEAPSGSAPEALLQAVDEAVMSEMWHRAITRPPQARFRVLVALRDDLVVGYAVTGPAGDPDADPADDGAIEEFAVDPVARRLGHGSRLLNACADTLVADGFSRATCWLGTTDDLLRRFLSESGWAPDGASREIGTDDATVRVKQVRLHVALAEPTG